MYKLLKQKRILSERTFVLYEDKLEVFFKGIYKMERYEIPLEEIGHKRHYKKKRKDGPMIITCIVCVLLVIINYLTGAFADNLILAILVFASLFIILPIITENGENQDDIILIGSNRPIPFFRKKPNQGETEAFIDEVIAASKQRMKEKYTKWNGFTQEETFHYNLVWLRNSGIISNEEYILFHKEFKAKRL